MGVIIVNGIEYSGAGGSSSNVVYLTQTEYDALPDSKLTDDVEYRITDAGIGSVTASNVKYDNSNSGLEAINTQSAIDSLSDSLAIKKNVAKTTITLVNTHTNFTLGTNYNWYMVRNGVCYFQLNFSISGSIASGDNYNPFILPTNALGNYLYFYANNGACVRISSGGVVRISAGSNQTGSHYIVGSYPIII